MFTFPIMKEDNWTPASIPTLVWCDASDINSITESGGEVSVWGDKSGNDNHLNAGGTPQTGTSAPNGLNRINLTATNLDYFSTGNTLLFSGDVAIFQVCQISNQTFQSGDSVFAMNASPNVDFQFDDTSTTTDWNGRIRASGIPTNNKSLTGGPYQGALRIFETVFDRNDTQLFNVYITGDKRTTDTEYSIGMGGTVTNFVMMNNRGEARFIDGYVCELVIIEDVTASQRQCMEGYLAHKWGIEGDLPSNHPYKNNPPKACLTDPASLNPEFHYSPDTLAVGTQDSWLNSGSETSSELVVLEGATPTTPPYNVNIIADSVIGYNVMRLNTASSEFALEMQSSTITPQSNFAMYMVVKSTDGIGNDDQYFATDGVYAFDDIIHWVYENGKSKVDLFGTSNQFLSNTNLDDDVWHVIGYHQESLTSVTLYTDFDDVETFSIPTAISAKRFDNFQIGAWSDGTNFQRWLHADIAEVIVIAHSITPSEARSVQQFLSTKYQTPILSV